MQRDEATSRQQPCLFGRGVGSPYDLTGATIAAQRYANIFVSG